jgi:signal transduction histidine kinase
VDPARRWQGVSDAVLAAALAAAGLLELTTRDPAELGADAPLAGAIGILGAAILLSQRRLRPALVAGVPLLWLALGLVTRGDLPVMFWGALVPILVALYSAARHAAVRVVGVTAGLTALVLVAGGLSIPMLGTLSEVLFDWGTCALALAVGWGLRRSEQRAVEEALRANRAATEAELRSGAAVSDERSRIARELHDVLGHSVSVMVVQAGAAAEVVEEDPEFVRAALAAIRTVGTEAMTEVRRAVTLLREPDEDPGTARQPGLEGIADLAAATRAGGLDVSVEILGDPAGLAPGLELAAYRIVQESLTNVRKHSAATRAWVRVVVGPDGLEVEVRDNGSARPRVRALSRGGEHAGPSGHGIIGMRERAHLYGGSLDAGPAAEGFTVRAVLPVGARA